MKQNGHMHWLKIDYAYVTLLMRERQSEMDVGVKMNTFMYMRVGG